ncbi:MAG: HEAT repeat domain-containing protein, partial [Armatimonadota bacterium]
WTLLIVAVAVIGGVYAITVWQRSRETQRLMEELRSPDHAVAAQAMTLLRERIASVDEELVEIAAQEGAPARWRAIELLAHADGDASRDALMNALQAPDPVVRAAAASALAERGVRGAADRIALMATAEEESMPVRLAAVRALQSLRTTTHLAELTRLATDRPPPPPVEEEADADEEPADAEEPAADEAADPAEEPVEEEPAEEWSDDTEDLRIEAVRAIAVLGAHGEGAGAAGERPAQRAVAVLAEAAGPREHSARVRQAACYALTDLAQLELTDDVRTRVVEELLAAADDEIGDVRIAAIHGLSVLTPPAELRDRVRQAMEDALSDDHYWVRVAAGEEPIGG